ncbi:putative solute-binding protein [Aquabacterium sp.]|uniref:putative solute-binding protein n=1 Tax=Aquabacterium sp. TaxID=1872578 RepID=UPI0035AEF96D
MAFTFRRSAHPIRTALGSLVLSLGAASAHAGQVVCVFDILGTQGPSANFTKDYVLAMQKVGADMTVKVYTDERVAIEDFRTGQCDAVTATGMRTRQFNATAASIDSLGVSTIVRNGKVDLPASYEVVHKAIQTFSAPAAAKLMVEGNFEVSGIVPLGAVYPIVNDRKISTVEGAAGKRIAAFDHDKAQAVMIQRIGAQPVSADVTTFATKFNNGAIDIIAAPALAYKPLELYRGIGTKGGVSRFPLMILSYQMIIHRNRFPEGFGEKSRAYWLSSYGAAMRVIGDSERDVPPSAWMDFSPDDAQRYSLMLRESRIDIAQRGLYDKRGLKVLKRIRCSINPTDAECASQAELDLK